MNLAHDNPLAGLLGIRKIYDPILRHFFWPGLKGDVRRYCKSCRVCQVAGKPNQTIPPAPLYPIPVVCEPFERVLVDCVGPLPHTKSGYLPTRFSHLSDVQSSDLIEYNKTLFADVPSRTHLLTHDIDVGDSQPNKQHPCRVKPDKRHRLKKKVEYMVQHDIAEPSCSAWSSPCLLVDKANGENCFCTDFRKVNGVKKPDCYPLPRMEDCVDRVGGARFITKIDLLKGSWQVPLTERAKEISAFVTPDDFLQYTVMAFGMHNAPATFQHLVNVVLAGLSFCEAYLDDLVVCS